MKTINNSGIHGYTDSYLDGNIRAKTVDGDIVTFNFSDKGMKASMQDREIMIPDELSKNTNPTHLIQFLKSFTIKVSDGKLIVAPIVRTVDGEIATFNIKETEVMINGRKLIAPDELRNVSDLNNLFEVLAKNTLKVNEGKIQLIPLKQATGLTLIGACAADGGCAVQHRCAADACAAQACAGDARCAADGCAAEACAVHSLCAADGCAADACAVHSECAAKVCAGAACGIDAIPCAGDAHVGPCGLHVPYCPIIF